MRGLLTLEEELRATRRPKGPKGATKSIHMPDPEEAGRPWQNDIDQVNQTMREVLRAIASLSGVELPGLPPGLEDDAAPPPRLDIKNLKDRFRNELEGFSIKTTEELTKRAKEQTHAAMDAVQNEVGGRIEQIATELREKFQSPAQIEKLVEPRVGEVSDRLERSFSQKVEQLFAEQQQLLQDKLQEALGSVQAQVSTQVDAEFREILQLPEHIENLVEPRVDEAAAKLERSLSQKVEQLFAKQEQLLQEKLQGALSPVRTQISTLEQTVQQIREMKAGSVAPSPANQGKAAADIEHLFAKQQELVQDKLQDALSSVHARISTVEEAAARPESSLSEKVEELFSKQEQLVQDKLQGALSSVQARINTLEQTVKQIGEKKGDSVALLPAERLNPAAEDSMKKSETTLNNGLKVFLDQAFSRIERSFNSVPQTPMIQSTVAGLAEQFKATPFADADMERRVQQALDNLDRLGSKSPHPVS